MNAREAALDRAGVALADAHEHLMTRDPAAQARAAYRPGGPTVAELETRIRRVQDAAHLAGAA